MAAKFGPDAAGVDRRGPHAAILVPAVEFDREQGVGGLGAAIGALAKLTRAAVASGDVLPDIGPEDVYRAMVGVSHGYDQPGWEPSARRLVGVFMAGLKAPG